MDDIIVYKDALVIPPDEPDALVTQRLVKSLLDTLLPVGTVIMWAGTVAAIPAGWALCNGQVVNGNTTPNLTDRFIVGAGTAFAPGYTYGNINTALSYSGRVGGTYLAQAQMPVHNHSYADWGHQHYTGAHTHGYWLPSNAEGTSGPGYVGGKTQWGPVGGTTDAASAGWCDVRGIGIAINNAGGGDWHDHAFGITMPWYQYYPALYALCFIMRVGNA
jgi:microcystin-dependent protein